MSVHTNDLCAPTINWALENLNDFTQPALLFLGLVLEERQFPGGLKNQRLSWQQQLWMKSNAHSCQGVGMQGSGSCPSLAYSKEHFHKELRFSHLFPGKHSNLDCRDWFCQKHRHVWHRNKTLEKAAIFLSRTQTECEDLKIIRGPLSWKAFKKAGTDAHSPSLFDQREKDPEWK